MRLEFDLGNSMLKWRRVDETRIDGGRVALAGLEAWLATQTDPVGDIWISSVASDSVNHQLAKRLQMHFGVAPEFARVSEYSSGLFNGYQKPEKMGVDRWLAMLAAWSRYRCALILIDAGSAITIERVSSEGHYLGGSILAGFQMQQSTLLGATARVRFELSSGDPLVGGTDTASCVASGAELVLRGIALQLQELVQRSENAKLVVTGGDAHHIIQYLSGGVDYEYIPELVMDGLLLADRDVV